MGEFTYLILAIDSIAATIADTTSRMSTWTIVAPAGTSRPLWTITGHMPCVATDTADDVGSEVLALRAIVLAVTNLTAVLASLIFVVSQGSVERSELAKLVTLELVLTLRNRSSLVSILLVYPQSTPDLYRQHLQFR
jgi:hypothetical protein